METHLTKTSLNGESLVVRSGDMVTHRAKLERKFHKSLTTIPEGSRAQAIGARNGKTPT